MLSRPIQCTLNFFKIVCKGDFFRKGRSNPSSACYKLSFELSTTSVRVDLILCSKISTNCTNSCSKNWINTYRGGWWLKWELIACWSRIWPSFAEEITLADYFEKVQCDGFPEASGSFGHNRWQVQKVKKQVNLKFNTDWSTLR